MADIEAIERFLDNVDRDKGDDRGALFSSIHRRLHPEGDIHERQPAPQPRSPIPVASSPPPQLPPRMDRPVVVRPPHQPAPIGREVHVEYAPAERPNMPHKEEPMIEFIPTSRPAPTVRVAQVTPIDDSNVIPVQARVVVEEPPKPKTKTKKDKVKAPLKPSEKVPEQEKKKLKQKTKSKEEVTAPETIPDLKTVPKQDKSAFKLKKKSEEKKELKPLPPPPAEDFDPPAPPYVGKTHVKPPAEPKKFKPKRGLKEEIHSEEITVSQSKADSIMGETFGSVDNLILEDDDISYEDMPGSSSDITEVELEPPTPIQELAEPEPTRPIESPEPIEEPPKEPKKLRVKKPTPPPVKIKKPKPTTVMKKPVREAAPLEEKTLEPDQKRSLKEFNANEQKDAPDLGTKNPNKKKKLVPKNKKKDVELEARDIPDRKGTGWDKDVKSKSKSDLLKLKKKKKK